MGGPRSASLDSEKNTDHHGEMEKFLKEQSNELEKVVSERTKKLEEANLELKRINEFTIGRELRVVELKNEKEELARRIKELEGDPARGKMT
jgi:vacuolar-type H+-ATPase subunit I/STV1